MASLLLAAGLLASLSAPRLDLYRSRSVPWVGQRVSYEAAVQGAAPGTPWRISVGLADGGESARIAGDTLTADDRGAAVLEADYTFARAGWYDLRALAVHEDQRLEATLRVPVTAYRVDFAWYQAEKGHELRWPTIQLTAGPDDAEYWQRRGVLPARWCGAMCGKDKPMEHFVRGWTSKPAIAIDEFGGSAEYFPKFHQALTEARKLRPDEFIAVWFCGWYEYFRDDPTHKRIRETRWNLGGG